jgi:hypothetical protein
MVRRRTRRLVTIASTRRPAQFGELSSMQIVGYDEAGTLLLIGTRGRSSDLLLLRRSDQPTDGPRPVKVEQIAGLERGHGAARRSRPHRPQRSEARRAHFARRDRSSVVPVERAGSELLDGLAAARLAVVAHRRQRFDRTACQLARRRDRSPSD